MIGKREFKYNLSSAVYSFLSEPKGHLWYCAVYLFLIWFFLPGPTLPLDLRYFNQSIPGIGILSWT